jgi:DNA (cytosine-5)-methyltransferase 1
MKAISLFSGAGGDTLGMHNAGIDVVAFSEIDETAVKTHLANFPESTWISCNGKGDITKIPDEEFLKYQGIDLIFAGFPCQAFSHAGKKKATDDPRGRMFLEFARATRLLKPKFIIGENVTGLLTRKVNDEFVFPTITQTFEDMGYKIWHKVMDASDYNTPQKRKRLIMVGCLDHDVNFNFPEKQPHVCLFQVLEKCLDDAIEVDDFPEGTVSAHNVDDELGVSGSPHPFLKKNIESNRVSFGKRISPNHGEIVDPSAQSKTIICAYSFQPRLYVAITCKGKKYLRTFTTRELAMIQGFPASYKFEGSKDKVIKQIGNAVPPNIVEAVCKEILKVYVV